MTGLTSAAEPVIHYRSATVDDAHLLFDWVNRSDCLAAKIETSKPIEWAVHSAWLEDRMFSTECRIWVATFAEVPIGQMRAEIDDDEQLHVDIYIIAPARGAGHGLAMLEALATESSARWPGMSLIARVRNDNAASRALFEKAGYELADSNDDYRTYVRAN